MLTTSIALLGDGNFVEIETYEELVDPVKGVPCARLRIKPTNRLLEIYGFKKADLDDKGHLIRTFPKVYVWVMHEQINYRFYLIVVNINGEHTPLSLQTIGLTDRIIRLQEENRSMDLEIKHLKQRCHDMQNRPDAVWREKGTIYSTVKAYRPTNPEELRQGGVDYDNPL